MAWGEALMGTFPFWKWYIGYVLYIYIPGMYIYCMLIFDYYIRLFIDVFETTNRRETKNRNGG